MAESLPSLDDLLKKLIGVNGSDLHLKVGSPPAYRIDGALHLSNLPTLASEDTERFAAELIPERVAAGFEDHNEADFAYGKPHLGRFRVNCYRQRGSINVVMRAVSPASKNFAELGLPDVVSELCAQPRGMILVTGPTGSGKTTTLGAMIDDINSTRRANIITLEDPIEILHPDKMSIVSQREVGVDTDSFAEGLRRILRQDPDVIFIGEMRDKETVVAALQAAETGHLVLSTLHTTDATETVNRIIDFFPPTQQQQVRLMLAGGLRGVVSQRLLPRVDGKGRVPATEILINTERVFDRISDAAQTHTLIDVIADGEYYGMHSFDQSIMELYREGEVTFQDALAHSTSPTDFKLQAQNMGLMSA
ncbi:MAG: type IV pilus twitching motility protein PilT [Acidimicrobiia bacterium]